ncbi:MAG: hypothetical protein WCL11_27025 [Verrucomicrobiota bacterium]
MKFTSRVCTPSEYAALGGAAATEPMSFKVMCSCCDTPGPVRLSEVEAALAILAEGWSIKPRPEAKVELFTAKAIVWAAHALCMNCAKHAPKI